MGVNTRLRLNMPNINRLNDAQIKALEKTGEALHTRVVQAQVAPFRTGNLQNESFFVDYSQSREGRVVLSHSTPYARRLYFHPEYNFSTRENPHAQGKWFSDWLKGGKEDDYAIRRFKSFLNEEVDI